MFNSIVELQSKLWINALFNVPAFIFCVSSHCCPLRPNISWIRPSSPNWSAPLGYRLFAPSGVPSGLALSRLESFAHSGAPSGLGLFPESSSDLSPSSLSLVWSESFNLGPKFSLKIDGSDPSQVSLDNRVKCFMFVTVEMSWSHRVWVSEYDKAF